MSLEESIWLGIGTTAQALFASRMLVQWWASEKKRDSVVPISFWYLSLTGGLMLMAYAIWRRDPVFAFGQGTGLFVYVRNLMLLRQRARDSQISAAPAPAAGCTCRCTCGFQETARAA